ncbi:hypothetical protein [Lactobacillus agrestimuris]|uniref:hypothetical protein n=1 Tax=Lactobacillus agrestimuris TaxID=2941328 RepID=UPI0020430662|nr:hypothetical protein [Lactobacillus agrestimuris]
MDNKKIEHGVDHKDDRDLYRTITVRQEATSYDGSVEISQAKTIKARDRITNLAIPEGQEGRVTYTAWKTVK